MKHVHVVVKQKQHEMKNSSEMGKSSHRKRVSFVEERGDRHKSHHSKTPGQRSPSKTSGGKRIGSKNGQNSFALHSKPVVIKFNRGQSKFYMPNEILSNNRSKQGRRRSCPSCSGNQMPKKSRTRKIILNTGDMQYREPQPYNRNKEYKSRPKKKFNTHERKKRNVEIVRPSRMCRNRELVSFDKNTDNSRKAKNETMFKPETQKHQSIPRVIKKKSRGRKFNQEPMRMTLSEKPTTDFRNKKLYSYKMKNKSPNQRDKSPNKRDKSPNKRECKKLCYKTKPVEFPIEDNDSFVSFVQSSPDLTKCNYKEELKETQLGYEDFEEENNGVGKNQIQEYQPLEHHSSNTCLEQNESNLTFDVINPQTIKDSLEFIQTNVRKRNKRPRTCCTRRTKSCSESTGSIKTPKKSAIRNQKNKQRAGKKIAFADIQSYRTFDSNEPPSKIGDLKTENVAQLDRSAAQLTGQLSEHEKSIVISRDNDLIREQIRNDENDFYENNKAGDNEYNKVIDDFNDNENHVNDYKYNNVNDNYPSITDLENQEPSSTLFDKEKSKRYSWSSFETPSLTLLKEDKVLPRRRYSCNSWSSLPTLKSSILNNDDNIGDIKYKPNEDPNIDDIKYKSSKNNLPSSLQSVSLKVSYSSCNSFISSSKSFPCLTTSPMTFDYLKAIDKDGTIDKFDAQLDKYKDKYDNLAETEIMDFDYYPGDMNRNLFKTNMMKNIKASPNFRKTYDIDNINTRNVTKWDHSNINNTGNVTNIKDNINTRNVTNIKDNINTRNVTKWDHSNINNTGNVTNINTGNVTSNWKPPSSSFRNYSELTSKDVPYRMSLPLKTPPIEYKRTDYRKQLSKSYTYNRPRTDMKTFMFTTNATNGLTNATNSSYKQEEIKDTQETPGGEKNGPSSRGFHYQYKPFSFCRSNMKSY